MSVVIDNSVLLRYRFKEVITRQDGSVDQNAWKNTVPLIKAIATGLVDAYAPAHLYLEFYQGVKRKGAGRSDLTRFIRRHERWLGSLRLNFISHIDLDYLDPDILRSLRLMVSRGAGSYDAIYMHLARQRGFTFCTCDPAAARIFGSLGGRSFDLSTSPLTP